jgi:ligand-binding sensor domain-containing protein
MLKFKHLLPAAALVVGIVSVGYAQPKNPEDVKAKETVYDKPKEFRIFASSSPVKAFAVNRNTLWFATDEIIINQPLNTKNQTKHPKIGDIPSANIKSMIFDVRGRLWVACESGVAMNSGSGTTFTSYTTDNGLPSNNALALTYTNSGEVWVGTEGGAARFRDGSWTKFTTADGLLSNTVQALVTDSKGLVYLGTNKGLNVWDGSKFQSYNAKNTGGNGIEWNNIKVLAASPKDVIWMTDGPETNNINNFNGKTWNRYMEVQKGITSIMIIGDSRRTWTYFGSESGILRFNGEEWVDKAEVHGIPAEQVYAMSRDSDGNLWFGMEKGVMMYPNPFK